MSFTSKCLKSEPVESAESNKPSEVYNSNAEDEVPSTDSSLLIPPADTAPVKIIKSIAKDEKNVPQDSKSSSSIFDTIRKWFNFLGKKKTRSTQLNVNQSASEDEPPSKLTRFVRSFSFLYKSNRNRNTSLNRSQSATNYRHSNSLPNIKRGRNSAPLPYYVASPNKRPSSRSTTSDTNRNYARPNKDELYEENKAYHHTNTIRKAPSNKTNKFPVINDQEKSESLGVNQLSARPQQDIPNGLKRSHMVASGLETPGVSGIQNHGNTCFMNSVIQCLSNTNPFAEYFVMDYYKNDLYGSTKSQAHPPVVTTEFVEQLAILLKSLWSCMYSSDVSIKFKRVISKYGDQYDGCNQHDAQEFLLWLLNKCHDDLTAHKPILANLPTTGNYSENGDSNHQDSTGDEMAALEYLNKCQSQNSISIINDLFQGQLKSSIICKKCGEDSKTFDPYLCLSLPVPVQTTYTIYVTAIYTDRLIVSFI